MLKYMYLPKLQGFLFLTLINKDDLHLNTRIIKMQQKNI